MKYIGGYYRWVRGKHADSFEMDSMSRKITDRLGPEINRPRIMLNKSSLTTVIIVCTHHEGLRGIHNDFSATRGSVPILKLSSYSFFLPLLNNGDN